MSDQEILPCIMCHNYHDQMLMLSCIHDPCINCAAIHFNQSSNSQSNMYSCSKCGQLTQLDESSILQLQKIYGILVGNKRKFEYRKGTGTVGASQSKAHSSGKKSQTYLTSSNTRDYENKTRQYAQPVYPVSQPTYSPSIPTVFKKTNLPYICPQHPEEQISYFCFSCQKPICPECAIHGSHRNHQVQTTRKAIKTISQHLNEWSTNISTELVSTNNRKENLKKKLKDVGDELKKQRVMIQDNFNKMRVILNQKEKQFLKVIESNHDHNSSNIKNSITSIDKSMIKLQGFKKSIESLSKKDDIAVLQDYPGKEEQMHKLLEGAQLKTEQDSHPKIADFKLMQEQIDQFLGILQAIRLSTTHK